MTDPSARRPGQGRPPDEAEAEQPQRDARRLLSRHYLAEIDRLNAQFLENPDERPNSGLREGDIDHGEVNAAIRRAEKTVVFGQQTRLKAGILMKDDERLPRFHAGHEMVSYFYRAIRLIPEYLLDAIFERGISVTMVKGVDLLVFHGPRRHQSSHTGRTRRTIYIPEGVLMAAFEAGYHPWAFTEILLFEAWKLLDYYLVVELARRYQTWMHGHYGVPGFYWVKNSILSLNKHRRIAGEQERTVRHRFRRDSRRGLRRQSKQYNEYEAHRADTEFMKFYRHYYWDFYGWDRPGEENRPSEDTPIFDQGRVRQTDILLRDPYHVANDTFDERRERAWAEIKIDSIRQAFGYSNEYMIDRDIVHRVAFDRARQRGQALEPTSVDDLMHDLCDAARFGVDVEARAAALMERLVGAGLPGIVALYDAVAEEHALGTPNLTASSDDLDLVEQFKGAIQALSTTGPEGTPNSVASDLREYLAVRLLRQIGDELARFMALPKRERIEGRYYLRALTLRALELVRPDLDEAAREEMVAPPARDFGPSHHVTKLADVAEGILRRLPEDREAGLLFDILRKMDLHPRHGDLLLQQARELSPDAIAAWGDGARPMVSDLRGLIPENPHMASSDPAGVRARLNRFDVRRRRRADPDELLGLLAGVIIRLDRLENYQELLAHLVAAGEAVAPALEEAVRQIESGENPRQAIRAAAQRVLRSLKTR